MGEGYPLRLYANPVKLLLLLVFTTGLAGLCYWLLKHPQPGRWFPFDTFMAIACIALFGTGGVVLLLASVIWIIFRRPLLAIDGQGLLAQSSPFGGGQAVNWPDISDIVVVRQRYSHSVTQYHLLARVKDPAGLPHPRWRAFNARFYPQMANAGAFVTLNFVFLRTTPTKIDRLLERFAETCAHEIKFYGIGLHREIHDL